MIFLSMSFAASWPLGWVASLLVASTAGCERCTFEADRGRDKEFIRFDYYCDCYDTDILLLRLGLACDAVLAQLPLNKHGRNPSNYGDSKVY